MNLLAAQNLAVELMQEHNLIGWQIGFDRGKKRFGLCKFNSRMITLSYHLVELNDEKEVRNVILHEIAHALAGYKAGHNWQWKQVARSIGCTGNRCFSYESVLTPDFKYVYECACGMKGGMHRRPKYAMNKYRCRKCKRDIIIVLASDVQSPSIETSGYEKSSNY